MKPDTREETKKAYVKPELFRFGTVQAITAGSSGNFSDGALTTAISPG